MSPRTWTRGTERKLARLAVLAVVAAATFSAAAPAFAATQHGFIATRDGTMLRYSLDLPAGPGPFPVLINYEGYAAGATPGDNGVSTYEPRLLARGYAVMGLQVRGTGCSQGSFDVFLPDLGQDGYDAVEWAARQPWSNGHVGMIGVSFGGITQLATAADRPPHLDAIAASSATSDYYRDVVYPGGVFEYDFPFIWTELQKGEYATAVQDDPDPECAALYAEHEPGNLQKYFIPTVVLQHPFDDSWYTSRQPNLTFHDIAVPTLMFNQWQDEQLPGRIFESLGMFSHPDQVWANYSNGNHGRDYYSPSDQQLTLDFLDHFVRGVPNRFPSGVPHLMIDMETAISRNGLGNEPAWRIGFDSTRDFSPAPWPLYLQPRAALGDMPAPARSGGDSYKYPLPSADVFDPSPATVSTGQALWKAPPAPGGVLAYTSGPLTRDAVVAGPSSLDLWLASTATDTDIQVTVSEVRPDGQEVYIQRGWLRGSHRTLDPLLSTVLRPYPTDQQSDAQPLTPGQPTLLRVPIFPFAYTFRKGSRIRVIVDAPTSHTGFWAFDPIATNATNTILHDPAHQSRLVLGLLPRETARVPLPACDTLRDEPCRQNPWPTMTATPLMVSQGTVPAICASPSGTLSGRQLGPLALGLTRAQARRALPRYTVMHNAFDDFCLAGGPGIRVGYPTVRLLHSLNRAARRHIADRIVIALTANRTYTLNGVRPGTSLGAAKRQLHLGRTLRIGRNDWYLIRRRTATGVLKVRHGLVREVGLANPALTATRSDQRALFNSWLYV